MNLKGTLVIFLMKVIVSLTSIPPRFKYLTEITTLLLLQKCDEVWVNIPKKYTRFPEWDGTIPAFDTRVVVNRECDDLGPATKYFGSALLQDPETYIIYVDDDTIYGPNLCEYLVKIADNYPNTAWGMSGFLLQSYFKRSYVRLHNFELDVLEGYGGVIVKAAWIQAIYKDFVEIIQETPSHAFADDLITSNLLSKIKIKRKTYSTDQFNLGKLSQLSYGFQSDALHVVVGGDHNSNYKSILKNLQDKGKSYFEYKC